MVVNKLSFGQTRYHKIRYHTFMCIVASIYEYTLKSYVDMYLLITHFNQHLNLMLILNRDCRLFEPGTSTRLNLQRSYEIYHHPVLEIAFKIIEMFVVTYSKFSANIQLCKIWGVSGTYKCHLSRDFF